MITYEKIWKMPVPVTALFFSPAFSILDKRSCQISLSYEGAEGDEEKKSLLFSGCEVFRCTYRDALTPEQVEQSYGCVVSVHESQWLKEASRLLAQRGKSGTELRHLMICFDDGPCYEFICRNFAVN
jgi:hypothetical protein